MSSNAWESNQQPAEPIENGNHHQIWQCYCGKRRAWGNARPEDPERVVLLRCRDCRTLQPHGYLRMKHQNANLRNQ